LFDRNVISIPTKNVDPGTHPGLFYLFLWMFYVGGKEGAS